MKRIITKIAAGIALLSTVGVVQAAPVCIDDSGEGLAANCPLINDSTNDPAISGEWAFSVPANLDAGTEVWIGSEHADEYYYQEASLPNFKSMLLSDSYASDFDDISISVWNGTGWSGWSVLSGLIYDFGSAGVTAFHLSGIDYSVAQAAGESLFLTGVTFVDSTGDGGTLIQTPVHNSSPNGVPEPGTALLLASGLLGFGLRKKQ